MPAHEIQPPAITSDMRQGAKSHPNSWLRVVDPAYRHLSDAPDWAVVGSFPVNSAGQVEDEFHPNAGYRPPAPPLVELAELLHMVKAGDREQAELPAAVRSATLLLFAKSTSDPHVHGFRDQISQRVLVPVCTAAERVPDAWPMWREMRGSALAPLLAGCPLLIDPDGPVSAVIPAEALTIG
ncbi:MAG: type VII secretion system-associated protein [Sciscionella sp.]